MLIGVTYDLRDEYRALGYSEDATAEFDDAVTIDAIISGLSALGHAVVPVGNIWKLTRALADGQRWDLVFNIAEGLHGIAREAQVPALLEAYNIPCVFSPPEVLMLCHDKALAKLLVAQAGLQTADWQLIRNAADIDAIHLPMPLFIKPVAEGTSKGVTAHSLVENTTQLFAHATTLLAQYAQPMLVERYLPGREFTVGIVGCGAQAQAIGAVEVAYAAHSQAAGRTYDNKSRHETLADYQLATDAAARDAITLALNAWQVLDCRDGGRVDIRCDAHGVPHFLEINPLPGLKPAYSDLPVLAEMSGMSYTDLLAAILASACERVRVHAHEKRPLCAS